MEQISDELRAKAEKLICESIYIGDARLVDLMESGRLVKVGFCKECDYHLDPLPCVTNDGIKYVTPMSCSQMITHVEPNGWCYKFKAKQQEGEEHEQT